MMNELLVYVPIALVLALGLGVGLLMLWLSNVLGPRRPSAVKETPFEFGSQPVSSARERFGVKFYTVAILFIVFDIEAVFVYPWAVLLADGLGWPGYVSMGIFVATLVAGLAYVWKKGVLDWAD
ncbi:MAG TPA: NADH-quinone oxidoreductase subunit A [Anaeromyxobacter sp.]|nr:NADH-quinone oxidoreductase subunit A [Anaeromyxobacter sp.]